jgi:Mu-like prophage protein
MEDNKIIDGVSVLQLNKLNLNLRQSNSALLGFVDASSMANKNLDVFTQRLRESSNSLTGTIRELRDIPQTVTQLKKSLTDVINTISHTAKLNVPTIYPVPNQGYNRPEPAKPQIKEITGGNSSNTGNRIKDFTGDASSFMDIGNHISEGVEEFSKGAAKFLDNKKENLLRSGAEILRPETIDKVQGYEKYSSYLKTGSKWMGKIARPLDFISKGLEIAEAEDKEQAVVKVGGGMAGSAIGSAVGGVIGSALIPLPGIGTAIGTIAGGLAGEWLGEKISGSIYDHEKHNDNASRGSKVYDPQTPGLHLLQDYPYTNYEPLKQVELLVEQFGLAFQRKQVFGPFMPEKTNQGTEVLDELKQQTESAAYFQEQTAVSLLGLAHAADYASYELQNILKFNDSGKPPFGLANGGILTNPHLGLVAEAGPEAIIPLSSRMRSRALGLWEQAGYYLGVRTYAAGGLAGAASKNERSPKMRSRGQVNLTVNINGTNLSITEIVNKMVPQIELALANAC